MVRYFHATIIVIFCILAGNILADQRRELFLQGNKAYQAGDLSHAIQFYKKIEHKGPGVWANLGNCYAAKGEEQQAFICWRRAQKTAPYDLWVQLEAQCKAMLESKKGEGELGQLMLPRWWYYFFPTLLIQILFLLCWYALFFFLLSRSKWRYRPYLIGPLIIVLCLFGFLLYMQYRHNKFEKGIVLKETSLKAGPQEKFDDIGLIRSLDSVQIHKQNKGWCKVCCENKNGWIPSEAVELL